MPCSDLYALAATFYHLITGQAPPHSQTRVAALASERPDPCTPLAGKVDGYPRAFLQAIDDAMAVFPQDRIQSARDWIVRIDESTRRALALAKAANDTDIENTVIKLIADAQREAEAAAPKPAKPHPAATGRGGQGPDPRGSGRSTTAAKGTPKPKRVAAEPPDEAYDGEAEEDAEFARFDRHRSDWIARARAKQTITRIDLYENSDVWDEEPVVTGWYEHSTPWLILGVAVGLLALCVLLLGATDILLPLLTWTIGLAEVPLGFV